MRSHVDRATRNVLQPIGHHRVPNFYLKSWTDNATGRLRATELDTRRTTIKSPKRVGVTNDYYSLDVARGGEHPMIVEHLYSYFENRAAPVLRGLEPGVVILPEEDRAALDWFLSAQMTRGQKFRRLLQDMARPRIMLDSALGEEFTTGEPVETMPRTDQVAFALRRMQLERDGFRSRHFAVYATAPFLVTSDEPVVPIDVDLGSHHAAVGAENAPIVVLPLAPNLVLATFRRKFPMVLNPRSTLTHRETTDLNRAILGYAYEEGYEHPDKQVTLTLPIPPLRQTTFLATQRSDGRRNVRITDPARWVGNPDAPIRVVERWWSRQR